MKGNGKPDFFDFDKYKLPEEWEQQPRLFWEHSAVLADKRADQERARAEEKVVYAEVEQDIRLEHERRDEKITEAAVKAGVLTNSRYKEAVESRIMAEHATDIAQAAVMTLDHRKRALENETSLFLANVYAKPRAPKGTEDEIDMMRKRKLRNKQK